MLKDRVVEKSPENENELKLTCSFEQLVQDKCPWIELVALIQEGKSIWTTDTCCIVPGRYKNQYCLEILCDDYQMGLAGCDAQSITSTLTGILQLMEVKEVTFQCFATQPRQPFPSLQFAGNIKAIRFRFVELDRETFQLFFSASPSLIELVQCTVTGGIQLAGDNSPERLIMSGSMVEFAGLAPGLAHTNLKELELLLHFWLQGEAFETFCKSLETNKGLRQLQLKYLDINDDGWIALMKALHQHPTIEKVTLAFTDNFVDNFRRLTPERRTARTQAVLDLVKANKSLKEIVWPEFQQDEGLMVEVNNHLKENGSEGN